MSEDLMKQKL